MGKAATDIQYGNQFFKEGTELPAEMVKIFELKNPSLLADRIEINGRWIKITDPIISGFVQEQRHSDGRLVKYFGKETPEVKKEPESHMLKTHLETQKEAKFTEEELFELTKSQQITLLEKLNATKIPNLEKDRVALILKLQ